MSFLHALCLQVQNWQTAPSSSAASASSQQHGATADELMLTLTIASEELPAAEAVIAGMYEVNDASSNLQQNQLVQALIIADMIEATEPAEQAIKQLQAAAASQQGLSAAALDAMAGLPAWPECLMQLLPVVIANASCLKETITDLASVLAVDANKAIQRSLASVFDDLQAVWRDNGLTNMLLQLPCPAMQLLLSSDDLKVPSDNIILYTAQQYVEKQQTEAAKAAARSALAGLVRAPHLSDCKLHYVVLSDASGTLPLGSYSKPLRQRFPMRRTRLSQACNPLVEGIKSTPGTPGSWQLEHGQIIRAIPAAVVWRLSIQQIKEACQRAFATMECRSYTVRRPHQWLGFVSIDSGVRSGRQRCQGWHVCCSMGDICHLFL